MQLSYKLSDRDKLIIRILFRTGKTDFNNLISIYERVTQIEPSVDSLIDKINKKNNIYLVGEEVAKRNQMFPEVTYKIPNLSQMTSSFVKKGLITLDSLNIIYYKESNLGIINYDSADLTVLGKDIAERIIDERDYYISSKSEKKVFIACAFGYKDVDELYFSYLKNSCEKLNLIPIRIDLSEPQFTITNEIINEIIQSNYMIADLTYSRPSVYYEIGFAKGFGLKIILTCRLDHLKGEDDKRKVHFDLEQYKISFWEQKESTFNWNKNMDPISRLKKLLMTKLC